jgi:RimJ/RimL family protein N-acetyltransferase
MLNNWVPHPTILHATLVDLIPLEENLFEEMHKAASDKRIWEFNPGDWSVKESFWRVYKGVLNRRENGEEYPFVIYHKSKQKIIGSTRLMDIVQRDNRLEIGGTWLEPEYWATAINFDCKLALLTFCFEQLGVNRVQLKTQHDNIRSRKAIEKIGGLYEGVIRQHILKDNGTYRSSAYFSILKEEWDSVKPKLQENLESRLRST